MPHVEHPLGWPSVTEVLKEYAMSWLEFFYKKHKTYVAAKAHANARKEAGSRCHEALEVLLKGGALEEALSKVHSDEEPAIREMDRVLRLLGVEAYGSERHTQSVEYQYHGSLDGLIKVHNSSALPPDDFLGTPVTVNPGVTAILDLKTKEDDKKMAVSELRKHFIQEAGYGQCVCEEDGEWPELGIVLQLDIPTATVRLHCAYPLKRFLKPFLLQRAQYDYINGCGEWQRKK